jgi:mRNA interferase RelE/StbE
LAWTIQFSTRATREIEKLDRSVQKQIRQFLRERIAPANNPRVFGHALTGELGDLWRYRVGDYRLICKIQDEIVTILVVRVGHRREIYR